MTVVMTKSGPPPAAIAAIAPGPLSDRSLRFRAMGGWVTLRVAAPAGAASAAERDLAIAAARIRAWADRITRFDARSELASLNAHAAAPTALVGPTMADLLARSRDLADRTDGLVDVTLLSARLAAEAGTGVAADDHGWWLEGRARVHRVHRSGRVLFDLDGVGKGWIADRALALLGRYPAALVDADGDVAMRMDVDVAWGLEIADPQRVDGVLGLVAVPPDEVPGSVGVATSGTSVHRWQHEGGWSHHLIDPRTRRPAESDVVQATVVAESALSAEGLAKAMLIAGSVDGLRLLDQAGAHAAVMLLMDGQVIGSEDVERWLV